MASKDPIFTSRRFASTTESNSGENFDHFITSHESISAPINCSCFPAEMAVRTYDIRPQLGQSSSDTELTAAFRIYMSPDAMKREGIVYGDWVLMQCESNPQLRGLGLTRSFQEANSKGTYIKMNQHLRSTYGFQIKDKLTLSKYHGDLKRAKKVIITELSEDGKPLSSSSESNEELEFWATFALCSAEAMATGFTFEVAPKVGPKFGKKRTFLIEQIIPARPETDDEPCNIPYFVDRHTQVRLRDITDSLPTTITPRSLTVSFKGLWGLDPQLRELNYCLTHPSDRPFDTSLFNLNDNLLVLLHGPAGTGKTKILSKLRSAPWTKTFDLGRDILNVKSEKSKNALSKVFSDARKLEPCLITIDDIDQLVGTDEEEFGLLGAAIKKELDEILEDPQDLQVYVIATASSPAAVNGKVLRCFSEPIELPIPAETARVEILQDMTSHALPLGLVQAVAEKTPAYIAEDLRRLCSVAFKIARRRAEREKNSGSRTNGTAANDAEVSISETVEPPRAKPVLQPTYEDFVNALRRVRPTIVAGATIEKPNIRWSDIGGCEDVKRRFDQIYGFSRRNPDAITKFQVESTTGILLYGPPGCSKTLTAKAVATECGVNFLGCKGPELLDKYVGQTEKNIREIFQRAKAAAPSVLFFDEFDAIAGTRASGSGHDQLQTVTTLLTEMNELGSSEGESEAAKGILLMAATNRPWAIEPALLRPGRMGTLVYMGPPDRDARKEILVMKTQGRRPGHDLDVDALAERTEGYSAADVVELCRLAASEAATEYAAMKDKENGYLHMSHFEAAFKEMKSSVSMDEVYRLEEFGSTVSKSS